MADITIVHSSYHERAIVTGNSRDGIRWIENNWGDSSVTLRVDKDDAEDLKKRMEADGLSVSLV